MPLDTTDSRAVRLNSLRGQTFRFAAYHAPGEDWNHDHCVGCFARFAERFAECDAPGVLHEGYVTSTPYAETGEPDFVRQCREQGMRCLPAPSVDGAELEWLCPQCFEDFVRPASGQNYIIEPA